MQSRGQGKALVVIETTSGRLANALFLFRFSSTRQLMDSVKVRSLDTETTSTDDDC